MKAMENLYIKPGKNTPEIFFSPSENIFFIRGSSSPEDVRAIYYPAVEWIKIFAEYVLSGEYPQYTSISPVIFKIDLKYFNSSSANFLFEILSELKELNDNNIKSIVEWHYDIDDSDHKEAGSDLATLAGIDITFVPRNESD
jgi:hypothetical protein